MLQKCFCCFHSMRYLVIVVSTHFLSTFYSILLKITWIGWVITIIAPLHQDALRLFRQYTTSLSDGARCIYAIYYQYSSTLKALIVLQHPKLCISYISDMVASKVGKKREREWERERERENVYVTSSITHILFRVIIVYLKSVLVIATLRVLYHNIKIHFEAWWRKVYLSRALQKWYQ